MSVATAIAIYFLIWWVTLFAVLPWGVQSQGEGATRGTDPGAPRIPALGRKLIWTTLVSGVIFVILWAIYQTRLITLDDLTRLLGAPF